jgi:hypothetical protein
MNKGDILIERGANKLQELSQRAAAKGGPGSKLANVLGEDAAFLRKLKPSLIAARARGDAPTAQPPGTGSAAPGGPQLGSRPKPTKTKPKKRENKKPSGPGRSPNPFLVAGIALAAGIVLAKVIDWRSHAHPRE